LLGGGADERLESVGDELGHPGHVVAEPAPAFDRDGRFDDRPMRVGREVGRGGQQRRAGSQGQGGRTGGHGRALTEEGDRDAVALDVPIREQAHHLGSLDGAQHLAGGARPEGHDRHPEPPTELGEEVEQLDRLDRLDHHRHRDLQGPGQPESGPLPATEVRQDEDGPDTAGPGLGDVAEAVDRHAGVDLLRGEPGQAERVHPVAPVGAERLVHRAPECGTAVVAPVGPPQVALDEEATLGGDLGRGHARHRRRSPGDGLGDRSQVRVAGLVQRADRLEGHRHGTPRVEGRRWSVSVDVAGGTTPGYGPRGRPGGAPAARGEVRPAAGGSPHRWPGAIPSRTAGPRWRSSAPA
jgi:hypothetical protein